MGNWGFGLVVVSVVSLLGCSGEVADVGEGETIGEQSAALREGSWPFQDELTTPWSSRTNEPHPYPELPLAGATYFGNSSVILSNGYDLALEVGGVISHKCPGSTPSRTLEKRLPGTVSPLKDGQLIPPHGNAWIMLSCSSSQRSLDLQYRARAPEGAVPFKDAFTETGDGFNFFPFEQTRITASVPIARSGSIAVSGAGSHKLFIRYAHPHPTRSSAIIKIGVQNAANGATIKTASNVPFAVTERVDAWRQWQVVSFDFNTSAATTNVYARLELRSDEIVYLDSAWVL